MTQVPRQRVGVRAAQPLIAGLALLACSAPPRGDTLGTPAPPAPARDIAPALDRYFSSQFAADDPGGAVLVMKHDRVVFARGYGLADLKTREPASTRTLFNIASVTKPFVASAILQ